LERDVLSAFEARGIANTVVDDPVRLEVTSGVVLVIASPPEPMG
jgi:thiamine pyrophosphokinase